MEEYKSNSHKQKEKKVEQVVNSNVKTRKKSDTRKFADLFLSEDVTNVKSYIIFDVLIPTVKKMLYDAVKDGLSMTLFGGAEKTTKNTNASRVSYRNFYDKDEEPMSNRRSYTRTYTGYNFDDIVLESRGEAEDVLMSMDDLITKYGMVSVSDLYDLVGITGNYTDNKYGWTDIRNASVVRIRDGYVLKLPKALPLN